MGILSNFLGLKDGRADDKPLLLRPATDAELPAVLRLILGGNGTPIHETQVQDFLAFARERGMDLSLAWVAEQREKFAHAVLPVPSPGRTTLIFASPPVTRGGEGPLARLIEKASAAAGERGIHLAQALIDPSDEPLRRTYAAAGFTEMAELIYLSVTPHRGVACPVLPDTLRWDAYSPQTHARFADAILASYESSLDCPALNGLRDIEDVIDGHKASGVFEPKHWLLLSEGDRTLGVLILAATGRDTDSMELVYTGLTPAARGRRLGDLLMQQSLATVAACGLAKLSLAVDALNVPALKLYYRHGMSRLTSKLAVMRDLRERTEEKPRPPGGR